MKTLAFSLLLLTMVAGLSNAQNVEIPDTMFLYALIEKGVDTDEDSLISNTEAEAITYLIVSSSGISDITGVEAFVNLDLLYCNRNQLTSLDVSNNTALERLNVSENDLTSLDVSNNTALWLINCLSNKLTSLDVSNNTALERLNVSENDLTSLDVSNNSSLVELRIIEMPTLGEVCVWEMPFPPVGVAVDTTGSLNVYFTTDCSK